MRLQIAVIGPNAEASQQDLDDATYIGREIAGRGAILLTGGLGGVMRAATEGAVDNGGTAVSLAPGSDHRHSLDQNPKATVVVPTGIGQMRNVLLVQSAHAVIAVGCNWGTVTEIGFAMRDEKVLVCLRPWRIEAEQPRIAQTAQEAVEAVFDELRRIR
ncbi:dethiobiotin synthetase [Actinoplanes sp. Pm04-4]|uniref:Dethiobiotin synthetase n=1 Tax=Paractinoplanes pyxinae TaxID=2997416 RepID=A0ABT4ASP0_9ACTN|nr:dethiobiotin synthetase [Actinoplanes pyxinae]MCY1137177.1 dethiobiotin synthetase [Actinoplanes pyxinae]